MHRTKLFSLFVFIAFLLGACGPKQQAAPVFVVSPVDPAHIMEVSKFRSCSGHDFSPGVRGHGAPGAESARSMKHYLKTDLPLLPANSLPVYAPVNGVIEIQEETFALGKQVYLQSGGWSIRIFHIDPSVANGAQVKAGDQIGTIPPANAAEMLGNKKGPNGEVATYEFDIAVTSQDNSQYLSMFDLMDPAVAQEWSARGFTSENTMISKEARDASPCQLGPDGERFLIQEENPQDWVPASH